MLFLLSDGSVSSMGQQNESMKHVETPSQNGPPCSRLATNAQGADDKVTAISSEWWGFIKVSPTTNKNKRSESKSNKPLCNKYTSEKGHYICFKLPIPFSFSGPQEVCHINLPYFVKPIFTDGQCCAPKYRI